MKIKPESPIHYYRNKFERGVISSLCKHEESRLEPNGIGDNQSWSSKGSYK